MMLVYPKDETTDFLEGIPNFLFGLHGKESFIYQRLGFSDKEHINCIIAPCVLIGTDCVPLFHFGHEKTS